MGSGNSKSKIEGQKKSKKQEKELNESLNTGNGDLKPQYRKC